MLKSIKTVLEIALYLKRSDRPISPLFDLPLDEVLLRASWKIHITHWKLNKNEELDEALTSKSAILKFGHFAIAGLIKLRAALKHFPSVVVKYGDNRRKCISHHFSSKNYRSRFMLSLKLHLHSKSDCALIVHRKADRWRTGRTLKKNDKTRN